VEFNEKTPSGLRVLRASVIKKFSQQSSRIAGNPFSPSSFFFPLSLFPLSGTARRRQRRKDKEGRRTRRRRRKDKEEGGKREAGVSSV
jgi:hypothetical protein